MARKVWSAGEERSKEVGVSWDGKGSGLQGSRQRLEVPASS